MTAPGPVRPKPGSAAFAGRPGGVSWILPLVGLLVALLVALPCAGSAHAATPVPTPAPVHTATAAPSSAAPSADEAGRSHLGKDRPGKDRVAPGYPFQPTLCMVSDPDRRPGDGCSSHPFSGQEAQLPNAPPHPGKADPPLLVTVAPAPALRPADTEPGPRTAPDLHLLQVNRT
ncbi:hypothetical protein [Kitasatospora sp. NBC_01302]|uniref:hypothetical protein n=1 Tax=Kitasatospora sp. NBC_01302 TaxID=2903575 RepID=UPI002E12689E|nr:hypothetical protein OG294_30310 [Kitasatospora sp. NBC_01302]